MGYCSELEYYSAMEKYPNKKKKISKMYEEKVHGLSPSDWEELENEDD